MHAPVLPRARVHSPVVRREGVRALVVLLAVAPRALVDGAIGQLDPPDA